MPETVPSSFSLWLEEALTGWVLPVAALVAVGVAGALYVAGVLPEGWTGGLIVLAVSIAAAGWLVREALAPREDPLPRTLLLVAAAGVLVLTAWPAFRTVVPGAPLAEGALEQGDALAVPHAGTIRVLVQGQLPPGGTPSLAFRLAGVEPSAEGRLERTYSYARVGRGARTRVAHDRTSTFIEARLPRGASLQLESLRGDHVGPLQVAVFPEPIPGWLLVVLAVAIAAVAAIADARIGKGNGAVVAGMALAFGVLVTENATPASAVGETFGSILLGAIAGALGGAILGFLARRAVPAPRRAAARAQRR
jgi:hypothetical protein